VSDVGHLCTPRGSASIVRKPVLAALHCCFWCSVGTSSPRPRFREALASSFVCLSLSLPLSLPSSMILLLRKTWTRNGGNEGIEDGWYCTDLPLEMVQLSTKDLIDVVEDQGSLYLYEGLFQVSVNSGLHCQRGTPYYQRVKTSLGW
jgi:hypothetical protein